MLITFIILTLLIINVLVWWDVIHILVDRINDLEKKLDLVQDTSSIAFDLIRHHRHDASCHTKNPAALNILPNRPPRYYDPVASLDDAECKEDFNE